MGKKILWISPHLPYDTVSHAGGQVQNFYLNKVIDSGKFDVRLISFYWDDEIRHFTLNNRIKCELVPYHSSGIGKILRNIIDINYQRNPFHRYANSTSLYIKLNILDRLKKLRYENFYPDVIILQWTQVILFIDEIKSVFSNAKIIGIEEDVTFQSFNRKIGLCGGIFSRFIRNIQYKNIYVHEIKALRKLDLLILNNEKDRKLIAEELLDAEIKIWSPFYKDYENVIRGDIDINKVVYFGDMSRPENYKSAEWFIEKVMPLLENTLIRFEVIGGRHPDQSLYQYENKRVHIAGYVEDIAEQFSECLCMVAPLVLGAGIKIKILEAMSAGVPVLTNQIGIEGIPASNGKEYLFCDSPEQYADAIKKLQVGREIVMALGEEAKKFVHNKFDYEKTSDQLVGWIWEI